ncbi:MAG: DUF2508 family protein [Clostridium sp.]|nr:DUF2508 family protein [Clostridium sp.]
MDKNKILRYLLEDDTYKDEEREILKQIRYAIEELENARNAFNNVSDNKLIDICIHREDEATARYSYFLELAKQKDVKVNISSLAKELNYDSKW